MMMNMMKMKMFPCPFIGRSFSQSLRKKNYYNTLGLEQTATIDQIKEAYRQKAKLYHPDVNASADRVYEVFSLFTTLKSDAKAFCELNSQMTRVSSPLQRLTPF